MIRTPICDLLDIEHPIALGGMGSATSPALVAAVSRAGGLGALGCHYLTPDQIRERTAAIRQDTNKPFGLNFLTFDTREDSFSAALELRPSVMQFAWARPDQDLKPYFDRAHDAGCKVTYMAGAVPEALRAAEAGADIVIAQGTEGGGHVGWMASMPLIPMVVDTVAPVPVLAAGGFADGRGLIAALALGAEGCCEVIVAGFLDVNLQEVVYSVRTGDADFVASLFPFCASEAGRQSRRRRKARLSDTIADFVVGFDPKSLPPLAIELPNAAIR